MPKISPFIWFDNNALDAALFYTSLFPNSRMISPPGPLPAGAPQPVVADFEICGQRVSAINGGPHFKLSPAFSLYVDCKDQAEVDHYWEKLLAGGGSESQCGWLVDRFGLSWQVIPQALPRMMQDPDREKANRAIAAMMKMSKIIVADMEKAFDGLP